MLACLPQFHLNGTLQLRETCFLMHSLTVRIVEIDGSLIVLVLVDVTQVSSQLFIHTC